MINLQYLRELAMGDVRFEQAIITQFIVQVPQELKDLQHAIEKLDFINIKALAHGLKSSVAYMGLTEKLSAPLQRMETQACAKMQDGNFYEDFAVVSAICEDAINEARRLPKAIS